MFLDRKDTRWNADVDDELLNKDIINRAVKYQAPHLEKPEIFMFRFIDNHITRYT